MSRLLRLIVQLGGSIQVFFCETSLPGASTDMGASQLGQISQKTLVYYLGGV